VKKIFDFFDAANYHLVTMEKVLVAFLLFSMVFISFGQVIARNLFSLGFMWVDQMLRIEVIWVAFLGASLASEFGRHLCIDVLSHTLSGRKQKFLFISANCMVFIVCIFFFIAAVNFISIQKAASVSLIAGIPDWTTKLVIPYFFMIAAFRAIINSSKIISES